MKILRKLRTKIKDFFGLAIKLQQANKLNAELEKQNEFLISLLNDSLSPTHESRDKLSQEKLKLKAQKQIRYQEELEELEDELDFMENMPVSGKSNVLERQHAIESHRQKIMDLQLLIHQEE